MTAAASDALVVELRIDDPQLRARLLALLGDVPGLRLAGSGEAADLTLGPPGSPERSLLSPLTRREHDVIALLAEGLSNRQIGSRLGIAPDTAKFHVGRVIDKLDATGRTDAVAHAARCGISNL